MLRMNIICLLTCTYYLFYLIINKLFLEQVSISSKIEQKVESSHNTLILHMPSLSH